MIDDVIVIESKKETRAMAAGTVAKEGFAAGDCAGAPGKAPVHCRDIRSADKAGYEDGSSIRPIPKPTDGKNSASEQDSGFANLFRKLVKTGMRLYTWPEAD